LTKEKVKQIFENAKKVLETLGKSSENVSMKNLSVDEPRVVIDGIKHSRPCLSVDVLKY